MKFPSEPFKIKVVESIRRTPRAERDRLLREAGYNLFRIPAESVYIDLLTDSGTSAMSDRHGMCVPSNIHFDTTRANIEHQRAHAPDAVVKEAYDPHDGSPFKGNMDLVRLEEMINHAGREQVPLVLVTITNNSGGGQPVSMDNIRRTRVLLNRYHIPLFFDACRFAENCFFIKERESGYAGKTLVEIAQELFSYGDGCTMSAKKDGLVNIGGFLSLNDNQWAQDITNMLILVEGFPTYGGLAGRDLEAISQVLREVLDEDYLTFRVGQVRCLGGLLDEAGVPILKPVGGHAIYLNAKEFLPHIPQDEFPAQSLAVVLYREYGVRGVEIGTAMFGKKDVATGRTVHPELEMVRLAIPRRVYTNTQITYVAESIIETYRRRENIHGLTMTYEAPTLRHFTARFQEVQDTSCVQRAAS